MWFLMAFWLYKIYSNRIVFKSLEIYTNYYSGNTKEQQKSMVLHKRVNLMVAR